MFPSDVAGLPVDHPMARELAALVRHHALVDMVRDAIELERSDDEHWIARWRYLPGANAAGATRADAARRVLAIALLMASDALEPPVFIPTFVPIEDG